MSEDFEIIETKRRPIIVQDMTSSMFTQAIKEKVVFRNKEKQFIGTAVPIPVGYVRCIVIKSYDGMTCKMLAGDIVDLPERRYKTLSTRNFIDKYEGDEPPCNKR